jgi:hypothetical protein
MGGKIDCYLDCGMIAFPAMRRDLVGLTWCTSLTSFALQLLCSRIPAKETEGTGGIWRASGVSAALSPSCD